MSIEPEGVIQALRKLPVFEGGPGVAGLPVGPLSLNDEVAVDLSYKIFKASIADLGPQSVDPRHMELVTKLVEDEAGRCVPASKS